MNAYLFVSSFFVSVLTLFFLLAVTLKGFRRKRNLAFCVFAVSVFVWSTGHMMWQLAGSEQTALFWLRILVAGSSVIPFAYFHFVSEVTGRRMPVRVSIGYGFACVLLALVPTDLIVGGLRSFAGFDYWPVAGPAFGLYFGGFAVVVVYCFVLLYQQYEHAPVQIRNQNKYLIIGTALGFFGGATNFPLWLGVDMIPWGHGLSLFYIVGIGYSVLRYRMLDFNEMAVRLSILLALSLVLGALFGWGAGVVAEGAYGELHPDSFAFWWGVFFVVTFLVLLMGPGILRKVDNAIQARIVAKRFAYREELRKLSDEVVGNMEDEDLLDGVVRRLRELMVLDYAGIFIRGEPGSHFIRAASDGPREGWMQIEEPRLRPILELFEKDGRTVFLEEMTEGSARFKKGVENLFEEGSPLRGTDAVVPVTSAGTVYGFLVLGTSRLAGAFAGMDVLLLQNLGVQLGLAMKTREMERRSNQMEKLVALGTMAAGLSHELRNPMVSVRTLVDLLKKQEGMPELSEEFRKTVERDVSRIYGIIDGVSAFSRDSTDSMGWVDLPPLLEEVGKTVLSRAGNPEFELAIDAEKLPPVWGVYDQLYQVFENLVENAGHAVTEWEKSADNGRVAVAARVRRDWMGGGGGTWVEVTVADNGPGISKDYQGRIFDPFVTSRDTGLRAGSSGTGLGLAIVSRIVERHQGSITVHSEVGKGAVFTVSLRCAKK